jgi:hypothetical protein
MTRTIQDHDFLVWEVYASGGAHGFSDNPDVIFHCLTRHDLPPRSIAVGADEAEAQRRIHDMDDAALLMLLEKAREI